MVAPYLIRVISGPKIDDETWIKWYITEHIPQVIDEGVAATSAFYQACNDFPLATKTPQESDYAEIDGKKVYQGFEKPEDKRFLAMYQTNLEHPMNAPGIGKVSTDSDTLPERDYRVSADLDIRVYKLIEEFDPRGLGDTPPPFSFHVQVEPGDVDDFHNFYRNEHLDKISKVPGYRCSRRYELTQSVAGTENPPSFVAVHEFDTLEHTDGPEQKEADASPYTIKVMSNAKMLNIRGFKLLKSID